jgi:hypothetical protein
MTMLIQGPKQRSGTFLFRLLLLFWLCASVLPLGYCVVADAGCNWYLHDINIFPLSKKCRNLSNESSTTHVPNQLSSTRGFVCERR